MLFVPPEPKDPGFAPFLPQRSAPQTAPAPAPAPSPPRTAPAQRDPALTDWDVSTVEAEILQEQSRLRVCLYCRHSDREARYYAKTLVCELRQLHKRRAESLVKETRAEMQEAEDQYFDALGTRREADALGELSRAAASHASAVEELAELT